MISGFYFYLIGLRDIYVDSVNAGKRSLFDYDPLRFFLGDSGSIGIINYSLSMLNYYCNFIFFNSLIGDSLV